MGLRAMAGGCLAPLWSWGRMGSGFPVSVYLPYPSAVRLEAAGLLLSSSRFLTRFWMDEALDGPPLGFPCPCEATRCLYSAAAASTRRSSSANCLFSSSLRTSGDRSCVSSIWLRSSSLKPPVASEPAMGVKPPLESMSWSVGVMGG